MYTGAATIDLAITFALAVGCTSDTAPRSNARLSMNRRFQRIGGTVSYASASSHQMNRCPFSIILLKKS